VAAALLPAIFRKLRRLLEFIAVLPWSSVSLLVASIGAQGAHFMSGLAESGVSPPGVVPVGVVPVGGVVPELPVLPSPSPPQAAGSHTAAGRQHPRVRARVMVRIASIMVGVSCGVWPAAAVLQRRVA
jgi:hypothetical protein